jgi:hypothetical protein
MYATKTTFAATTAVMAAKVESPRKQRVRRRRVVGANGTRRRTFPYELSRCEIGCNREDTERQTKDDELEKYTLAVDGPVKDGRNAGAWSASHPSSMDCPETCAETPLALILPDVCAFELGGRGGNTEGVGPASPNERVRCANWRRRDDYQSHVRTSVAVTPQDTLTSGLQALSFV